jgi:hypothetical protein
MENEKTGPFNIHSSCCEFWTDPSTLRTPVRAEMLTLKLTHTNLGKTAGTWTVDAGGNLAQSNLKIKE